MLRKTSSNPRRHSGGAKFCRTDCTANTGARHRNQKPTSAIEANDDKFSGAIGTRMPLEPIKPQLHELRRIRAVAAYQFGRGAEKAFPPSILIVRSPNTHRIRHVYNHGKLLATYRPKDGLLAQTVNGGLALNGVFKAPKLRVKVTPGVEPLLRKGGNVVAKHVIG